MNLITKESGLSYIINWNPNIVKDSIVYKQIPEDDHWKVDILDELLQLRTGDLIFEGDEGLNSDEVQALIKWVSSM